MKFLAQYGVQPFVYLYWWVRHSMSDDLILSGLILGLRHFKLIDEVEFWVPKWLESEVPDL